jgi:hypothetical protein
MTESKKPQPASTDALAKTSPQGAVELSEAALAETAGGAVFPSAQAAAFKFDSGHKIDVNPGLLLPAVKPGV